MNVTGTPFTCLHPNYVVNPYTHQKVAAYCGECAACVARKARRYETQIQLEAQNSAAVLFVTLTYANSYVPKMELVPVTEELAYLNTVYHVMESDTGEVFDTLSLKSSDVPTTIEAYRLIAEKVNYPLHLGVTEAGTLKSGLIKSSIGLGTLLSEGIGDTIRVSLTENPVEEVHAGFGILKALNLRKKGVNFISCPTCGRTQIDLIGLAKKVEERFKNLDLPITIAVMGCPVNGPGEAKHADFGIAGAIKEGYIFKKGEIIARVPESDLINSLENIIMESYSSVK